jgi:hypothetical protein
MTQPRNIITDKLVLEKTGKTMEEWFAVMDTKGAMKLDANGIYQLLQKIKGLESLGEWNLGLLSTSYQWSRGLRERGEKKDGFEVSISRTFGVPLPVLFQAIADPAIRKTWVKEKMVITKETANRSIRAKWDDDTRLSIDFYTKGEAKAQAVLQHMKIKDASTAAKLKEFWLGRFDALKETLIMHRAE